ncbi:hypothetical protein A8B78_04215 [Jannaschia sp. EhC01]|nr:hypothetical protein A8B78_04215 [Jannaschia sp. EhC01]
MDKLQTAYDQAFEVAAGGTLGKPIWTQIKQNAATAANGTGVTRLLLEALQGLRATLAEDGLEMELHLVGHSVGAIFLGHILDDIGPEVPADSATLLAPACTMAFATRHYGRALERAALPTGGLHLHALSDENERAETVGPYGNSLLYLVSRALESPRKQPLTGLARYLEEGNPALAAIAQGITAGEKRPGLNAIKAALSADCSDADL